METQIVKHKIEDTFIHVNRLSDNKNTEALRQLVINDFLDKVLAIKDITTDINIINSKLQEITWLNNLDDECLLLIKDLIQTSKKVHKKLIIFYANLNSKIHRKIAKTSIDDLKENNQDLYSSF